MPQVIVARPATFLSWPAAGHPPRSNVGRWQGERGPIVETALLRGGGTVDGAGQHTHVERVNVDVLSVGGTPTLVVAEGEGQPRPHGALSIRQGVANRDCHAGIVPLGLLCARNSCPPSLSHMLRCCGLTPRPVWLWKALCRGRHDLSFSVHGAEGPVI